MKTNHIAMICDDNYCFPTMVCIQSIIMNASKNYVVHVCSFGLSDHNCKSLQNLGSSNVKVVIDTFNETQYADKLNRVSAKTHVTPTALIKFELPGFFQEIDSILYLDSDIILKGSIDELFCIDIGDFYVAASYDFHQRLNKINYSLKRDYSDFYFNSGVMMLNLRKMREDDVTSMLWDYKINHAKTKLMDQESLNAVCGMKTFPLSLIWNFNPVFLENRYLTEINNVYHESFSDINQLENKVRIIHYVGKSDKPWIYENARLRKYWDESLLLNDSEVHLELKHFYPNKQGIMQSAKDKIALFGIKGFVCYVINKLLNRTLI